ncbi:MarR family winged helix-turn-helix transcriptional regulator [Mycobacterium sp. shizuoka-1]|uniref:MarR family winged helix-turn-helix transcriptional regulator n=1 Tax=Mycobacterium sp. shizuoka-1 TaxID=2039281 RepID=UPI000C0613F6|nr:MarR family winged helix-turn-helix transcriptional regulator [Mycobacterium sp. shizuoka-1]GAY19112.1 transcriptional regulator [Mycobacterium sp. shizuoka-1]
MPDVSTTRTDLAGLIGQIVLLAGPINALMARELTLPINDLAALHHLVGLSPAGPAELGRRLGMSSASATVLADRLERAGYIRRRRDPSDRRRIILEVTDATAARSQAVIGPLVEALTKISDSLDEAAQQDVGTYLTRVITAMANFAGADVSEHPS